MERRYYHIIRILIAGVRGMVYADRNAKSLLEAYE